MAGRKTQLLVQLIGFALPWGLRRRLLSTLGYAIHPSARIGFSLLLCRTVSIGEATRIGHGNMFRKLDRLVLGSNVHFGNFNDVAGAFGERRHYQHLPERDSSLIVGDHSGITHRHLFDCTDRVTIGAFTTIAGWNSQILTHAIEMELPRQEAAPVTIGSHVFLGTRSVVLKGVSIADRCVIGAGAVVASSLLEEAHAYGGVPARKIGQVDPECGYFTRREGYVE